MKNNNKRPEKKENTKTMWTYVINLSSSKENIQRVYIKNVGKINTWKELRQPHLMLRLVNNITTLFTIVTIVTPKSTISKKVKNMSHHHIDNIIQQCVFTPHHPQQQQIICHHSSSFTTAVKNTKPPPPQIVTHGILEGRSKLNIID